MTRVRLPHWLVPLIVLSLAAAGLGGLLFALAGNHGGRQLLASVPGAEVWFQAVPGAGPAVGKMAAQFPHGWRRWDGRGFMTAYHGEVLWVRVTLRNASREPRLGVLADSEYFADRAELFVPDGAAPSGWQGLLSGEKAAAADKALWGRDTAFPLQLAAGATQTVYWRLEDRFGIWLRPVWWPDITDFVAARSRDTLTAGLYFGALLAMLFYNAVLWARVRFEDTGRYLAYLGAFAGFMALMRNEPLAFGWPLGSPVMETLVMVLLAWSAAALASFARVTLELAARAPRAARTVQGMRRLMHLLALASLVTPWMTHTGLLFVVILGHVATHAVLLGAAVIAWRAGVRPAGYFLAAFGVLFLATGPTAWAWLNLVPLEQAWWAEPVLLTGSALQILLLGMAVADRFARLQQEKQTLQEAYADELEAEVRERTGELEAANADKDRMLLLLGHDLRSPLTALTQTAEQVRARPADPVGGFAGEVAAAGRQLLLLIEDIVLWARLRAGAPPATAVHAMHAVVESVVRLHGPLAARRGVVVSVHLPGDLAVRTDQVLAQALARNLVGNAVKFAAQRVEVTAQAVADGVELVVRDDGPGLPPAVLAQLEGGRTGIERGLGLRLCREISAVLGLSLRVRPAPNGGTEVSVILPAAEREAAS